MPVDISLTELVNAGAHFGHQARRWNPKMEEYLYGVQEGVHVFDLTKTKVALQKALEVLTKAAQNGQTILLLGTKKQVKDKVIEVGKETGFPYVSERWLGGTITNFEQIKKSLRRLDDIKTGLETGEFVRYTKREKLLLEREANRLERFFGGIKSMQKLPEFIFIVDTHREQGAVKEAFRAGITTLGIVDSNSDPTEINYPIPMNDDATKALEYVMDLVKQALLEGTKSKDKAEIKAAKTKK